MKPCSKCQEPRPLDQFYKGMAQCKACYRVVTEAYRQQHKARLHGRLVLQRRAARLGLTLEDYQALPHDPGTVCSVCGATPEHPRNGKWSNGTGAPKLKRLAIDHCHKTDRIRGFLCAHCNRAIGLANDDPALLRAMADYLERTEPAWEPLVRGPNRNTRQLGTECSLDGCTNVPTARNLCAKHYATLLRTGDPTTGGRRRSKGTCAVDGCERPHYGHGWCRPHLRRWQRYGDPLAGRPVAAIA
jgi:hypothetical protein